MLLDKFTCLRCCLAIGMDQIIAVGGYHHECVSTDCTLLAISIPFQRFAFACCFPLWASTVKAFRPRSGIIGPVTSVFDVNWYSHVKYFAHTGRVIARIFKRLRPSRPITGCRARTVVTLHARRVRIIPREHRSA